MGVDKLVDSTQLDTDLTSVANAIRTKGGTSASLIFPSDFVSAINAISGGGGTPAISVVDTLDAKGGTVRTITALDISDTTATASDVAVGKYFYTSNGTKTAGSNSGGGASSATAHTIYFEFTDNTNITITVYYDDSFISSAITATTPSTYGQKTVDSASLDGVEWYSKSSETWEIIGDYDGLYVNSGDPYGGMWISDLGDVAITVGSEWRVTFDGTPYTMTATANGAWGAPYNTIIGNPLYAGGTDDGSAVPFCFAQNPWGAWTGWADTSIAQETNHVVKIERLVTS